MLLNVYMEYNDNVVIQTLPTSRRKTTTMKFCCNMKDREAENPDTQKQEFASPSL